MKTKKPTYKELEQRLRAAHASSIPALNLATHQLQKLKGRRFMASALVVTITNEAGKEIVDPVYLRDGLSDEAIDSLLKEVDYSVGLAVAFAPKKKEATNEATC